MAKRYLIERNRSTIGKYNVLVPGFLGFGWKYPKGLIYDGSMSLSTLKMSEKDALAWIIADSRIGAEVVTPKEAAKRFLAIIDREED